eukprot:10423061-Alexandrium_andersonii.AAC.1
MSTTWRARICVRLRGRRTRAGLSFRTPAWAPIRSWRGAGRGLPVIRRLPPRRSESGTNAPAFRSGR